MAKFCTMCGKALEEGKNCNCKEEQLVELLSEKKGKSKTNFNAILENLVMIIKGTLKNPITTIKELKKEKYFISSIIMILINVIVITIFFTSALKEFLDLLFNKNNISTTINGMTGIKEDISIIGLGFKILVLSIIFYGLYSLIIWLITTKIMKKKCTYKQIISTMATPATISSLSTITSGLLLLILGNSGSDLYIPIFFFGQVLFFVYLYHSILISTEIKEDYAGYIHFIAIFIATFVVIVFAKSMLASYTENMMVLNNISNRNMLNIINLK